MQIVNRVVARRLAGTWATGGDVPPITGALLSESITTAVTNVDVTPDADDGGRLPITVMMY